MDLFNNICYFKNIKNIKWTKSTNLVKTAGLGVHEAPRRRHFIDLTSRIPQPLTIYTDCIPMP